MPQFNSFAKGIALGVGVALLVPIAAVTLAPVIRPVARNALKAGALTIERGREFLAETTEMVEDIVAETRAELRAEHLEQEAANQAEESAETVETASATGTESN
jgi:hypothetical protein